MGQNKKLRKRIAGLLAQVESHEQKIAEELQKEAPNKTLIDKWRKDIHIFELEVVKAARRLPGGRKES